LTVTDNDGLTGSASQSVTVVAAIPPVASFSVTQDYLNVAVDGSTSSDADGTIASYAWTFGDGGSATGVTAAHTYAAAGTYTITLTVTDNDGLTGTMSLPVTVLLPPPPTASFTYIVSGMTVDVDASGSTGTGLSYAWTWGDGMTGTGMTASHTYTAPTALAMADFGKGRAPSPPHPIYGFTWAEDGVTPVTDCFMTFLDVNTGKSFSYQMEAGANAYVVDASQFGDAGSYANGDTVLITATAPGYYGEASYVINMANDIDGPWDVILHPSGPLPFDVTITLTVTDMYGRTATISETVTITP
jgi:chitodextrinase